MIKSEIITEMKIPYSTVNNDEYWAEFAHEGTLYRIRFNRGKLPSIQMSSGGEEWTNEYDITSLIDVWRNQFFKPLGI